MKEETEPVTVDEWLIRLVWWEFVTQRVPILSTQAFQSSKNHTDGLSLYRRSCLADPADALLAFDESKRPFYAIVQIPIGLLREHGLDVVSAPINKVRGHVVVPQLIHTAVKANKPHFKPVIEALAAVASQNIIRMYLDKPER